MSEKLDLFWQTEHKRSGNPTTSETGATAVPESSARKGQTAGHAGSPAPGVDKEGDTHKSTSRSLLIKEVPLYRGIQVERQDYGGEV